VPERRARKPSCVRDMQIEDYSKLALDNFGFRHPGAFYGYAPDTGVGAGLIYSNVIFPLFDLQNRVFDTVQGSAYVLTHECDVEAANNRHFNDHVVICPLIPLEDFVASYEAELGEEKLKIFLTSLAKNEVVRVFFLPPAPQGAALTHGALLYLNHLCSAHISVFENEGTSALCALSSHALDRLDWKLQNLLFRPKDDQLPHLT
jgi:hypothetical protein